MKSPHIYPGISIITSKDKNISIFGIIEPFQLDWSAEMHSTDNINWTVTAHSAYGYGFPYGEKIYCMFFIGLINWEEDMRTSERRYFGYGEPTQVMEWTVP